MTIQSGNLMMPRKLHLLRTFLSLLSVFDLSTIKPGILPSYLICDWHRNLLTESEIMLVDIEVLTMVKNI